MHIEIETSISWRILHEKNIPSISNFKLNINESDEHGFSVIDFIVSTLCLIKQVNFFLCHPLHIGDYLLQVNIITLDVFFFRNIASSKCHTFFLNHAAFLGAW